MNRDLEPMCVADRLDRAVAAIDASGCDALLVTDLTNVGYLSGFSGSAAQLFVSADRCVAFSDGRYTEQLAEELDASGALDRFEAVIGSVAEQREALRAVAGDARLGIEGDDLTVVARDELLASLDAELVTTSGVIGALRRSKDEAEVARIELAAAIADQALADVVAGLGPGVREVEFARTLEQRMFELGADGLSFDTICASGPNSALPHARPSDRVVEHGDLVVLDFGALVDQYHSDMTRTFSVGEPGPEAAEMLEVVTAAQAAGADTVGPGVGCAEVDAACRDLIGAAGMGEWFVHGTGHGVGRLIHEAPWVNARSDEVFEAGQVVTVEPGVYRPGLGGVRVEDSLLVTASGSRPLTRHPKDPILVR